MLSLLHTTTTPRGVVTKVTHFVLTGRYTVSAFATMLPLLRDTVLSVTVLTTLTRTNKVNNLTTALNDL